MQDKKARLGTLTATLIAAIALVAGGSGQRVWALSPEDAIVQQAKDRGVRYLLSAPSAAVGKGLSDRNLGEQFLVAVALVKCRVEADHPLIRDAVSNLRTKVKSGEIATGYHSVYNLGVGLVLLSALKDKDPDKETAQAALKHLLTFQRSHGGFASNSAHPGGDTSMTQYAVLGMWEAARLGVQSPPQAWQGVCNWLIKTQSEEGTFVYNPASAGLATEKSPHSMTAAALSCLYICANKAGPRNNAKDGGEKSSGEVPSALVPAAGQKKEAAKDKTAPVSIDMGRLQAALSRSDGWMAKNFTVDIPAWKLYYLYALERYYAFRESLEGHPCKEVDWYSAGATFLLARQDSTGGWNLGEVTPRINTAFALLFLVQNTRLSLKTDEKAGGSLLSGSGLPADLTSIRVKDGAIVVKPLAGPAGELLDIIEKPDDPRFLEAVEGFGELIVKADDVMLSPHLVRLKKMAKSDSPEARAAAVAALGKSRVLEYAPTLIYALADEDEGVARAAWEALKFVSRRFDGFGLSPGFKGNDRERALARAKAIERWKQWYQTVQPDAEFDD